MRVKSCRKRVEETVTLKLDAQRIGTCLDDQMLTRKHGLAAFWFFFLISKQQDISSA